MRTTGPILAIGAITLVNASVIHDEPINWRVPIGTGLAVGMFALAEHGWPDGATALAWSALVTVLFVRLNKNVPSPAESFAKWWGVGGEASAEAGAQSSMFGKAV